MSLVLDSGVKVLAQHISMFGWSRRLPTSIENKWGATSVSKYEYTNDALGRRTSVTVSGSAFNASGTTGFDLFTYTLDTPRVLRTQDRRRRASRPGQADRNELATAKRYTGGTLENPTNPVYTRHFGYDYDPTLDMPRTLRVPERLRRAARQGQVGNRESYQIGQGTATTYTANELNQYTATADPSESFTHDDDGNLTQDGTFTYVWDAENRLIEAYPTNPTTGSQKCVMTYDYMNRRVQRSLYNWTGSACPGLATPTQSAARSAGTLRVRRLSRAWAGTYFSSRIFVYDRWNNLIAYNPAGGLSIHRKNTWGLDLSGLNGNSPSPLDPNRDSQGAALTPLPPGEGRGEGVPGIHAAGGISGLIGSTVANGLPPPSYLCFYDANGNLSETIKNSDGTLYSHHEYDPWGNQLIKYETAGIAHPFRYSTKYSDGLFEKYYFGQRYLDHGHGRWISRDLIMERGGLHLQSFAPNTPNTHVDPTGLLCQIGTPYCSPPMALPNLGAVSDSQPLPPRPDPCQDAITALASTPEWQEAVAISAASGGRCPLPQPICVPCTYGGGPPPGGVVPCGIFDPPLPPGITPPPGVRLPPGGRIILCTNAAPGTDYLQCARHELIHWMQWCNPKAGENSWPPCLRQVRNELEAYWRVDCTDRCSLPDNDPNCMCNCLRNGCIGSAQHACGGVLQAVIEYTAVLTSEYGCTF